MYEDIASLAARVDQGWPSTSRSQAAVKLFLAGLARVDMATLHESDVAIVKEAVRQLIAAADRYEVVDVWRACKGPILEAIKRARPAPHETQEPETSKRRAAPARSSRVFVVHGRNEDARAAMFSFLRAIALQPIEWSQALEYTGKPTPYVGEILDAAFDAAQAVIVLLSPDDLARLRDEFVRDSDEDWEKTLTPQARPNVLFEAGMSFGRFPDRTVLVELGILRPFSDIAGRHVLRLSNTVASRQGLAGRLKSAGCSVDTSGTDWHIEGDFEGCLESLDGGQDVLRGEGSNDRGQGSTATASGELDRLPKAVWDLLEEMRRDIEADATGLVREFALLPSTGVHFNSGKSRFVYYETEIPLLREKVDLLEEAGLVEDVTPGNTPIYRMTQDLVSQLRAWKS